MYYIKIHSFSIIGNLNSQVEQHSKPKPVNNHMIVNIKVKGHFGFGIIISQNHQMLIFSGKLLYKFNKIFI